MGYSPEINNSLTIEIINVFMVDLEFRLESSLLFIKDLKLLQITLRSVRCCGVLWCLCKGAYCLLKSESTPFFLSCTMMINFS